MKWRVFLRGVRGANILVRETILDALVSIAEYEVHRREAWWMLSLPSEADCIMSSMLLPDYFDGYGEIVNGRYQGKIESFVFGLEPTTAKIGIMQTNRLKMEQLIF